MKKCRSDINETAREVAHLQSAGKRKMESKKSKNIGDKLTRRIKIKVNQNRLRFGNNNQNNHALRHTPRLKT